MLLIIIINDSALYVSPAISITQVIIWYTSSCIPYIYNKFNTSLQEYSHTWRTLELTLIRRGLYAWPIQCHKNTLP